MRIDIMDIETLADGVVKVKTQGISDENHMSADELLDLLEEELGGQRQVTQLKKNHIKERRTTWQKQRI